MEIQSSQGRKRRVLLWSLIGVTALALIAGAGFAARKGGPTKNKKKKGDTEVLAAPVELSPVHQGAIATYLQNTTTLEARNEAVLVARRQGQVMALLVEEGARVAKGQPLIRLDDREARLTVQRTELGAEMAKRELERGKQLQAQGYLSPKELDDLELKMRNAWVELEQARFELSEMTLVAPFAGRVLERSVQLGETVTNGKACFRLADFDRLLARVYFPERELGRVRIGQEATLAVGAQGSDEFAARVSLVNPSVDRSNGTFKVTLEVDNRAGTLRPGAFARVRLRTGGVPNALLLPRRGVLSEDGEEYVYVARGDSVVRVAVRVGAIEGDTAQITAGLAAGDRVVTVGHGGLKPGAKIKPVTL